MRRDFEGVVYWDELADRCGNISRAAGFRGAATFRGIRYALKVHKCLKKLDLSNCNLTSKCAESLARILLENQCLEELNLSHNNKFGDDGIQHLTQTLRVNQWLTILDVSECDMTDEGLKQLTMSLTYNKSLTELKLSTQYSQENKFTNEIVPFFPIVSSKIIL